MAKTLTKPAFGPPPAEILAVIDASDTCAELQAATYRFQVRMADLQRQFEAKANEFRNLYLTECEQCAAKF